jgi:hypothetical protein
MKLSKFYNLDECSNREEVFEKLDKLQKDSKIEWNLVENEIIKIEDTGLLIKEVKDLVNFLKEMDVIEEIYYEENEDDEDFDSDEDDLF